MKPDSSVSRREDVLGYVDLIDRVAKETGLSKANVRKVIESMMAISLKHIREHVGGRVRFGRVMTLYSMMTSRRTVNNPQDPGNRVVSEPHLVMRVAPGTRAKSYLAGGNWSDED